MSELAKISQGCLIISKGGFALLSKWKHAKLNQFAVDANSHSQFSMPNANALVPSFIVFAQSLIAVVLLARTYTQILIDVIKWIPITMVAFARIIGGKPKQFAMEPNNDLASSARTYTQISRSIECLCSFIPFSKVTPSENFFVPAQGNAGHLSLRQLNFTVRFFKRHPQSFLSRLGGLFQQPMPLLYLGGA